MGCAAEDPPQRIDVGRCPDAETQASDPSTPSLAQRSSGVGFTVGALVAVVVGEPVGEDDEQPPRGAGVLL